MLSSMAQTMGQASLTDFVKTFIAIYVLEALKTSVIPLNYGSRYICVTNVRVGGVI